MPLARGTAACGYTAVLALFRAAGMPITARIPRDYQVRPVVTTMVSIANTMVVTMVNQRCPAGARVRRPGMARIPRAGARAHAHALHHTGTVWPSLAAPTTAQAVPGVRVGSLR